MNKKIAIIVNTGCLLLSGAGSVLAADWQVSGFGTVGGAVSDRDITYQRHIDEDGTLLRDSLLAVQLDVKINEQWSATSQLLLGAASDADNELEPQLKWTLLSYRPSNDWLFRVGRLSLGGMLNQQNMDVGVSYDMARLPTEVYFMSSIYDYDGFSAVKSWSTDEYEIALDASFGWQERNYRAHGAGSGITEYYTGDVLGGALILTVNDMNRRMLRLGWSINQVDSDDGVLKSFTYLPLGGGLYTLGRPIYDHDVIFHSLFVGFRTPVKEYMLAGEAGAIISDDLEPAPTSYAGYLNISRKFGQWTPYITYAQIATTGKDDWRRVKNATPVPWLGITGPAIVDAASKMGIFDQQSVMLGVSYAFTPQQKIKAEAMLTHVGDRSAMFDQNVADENVMVYSLSYSFSF